MLGITTIILVAIIATGFVTSTPVSLADTNPRDDHIPWSKASCKFSILYGELILSTLCKNQYTGLDLNMCFMNNNGTISRLAHGGFAASCLGCDFSNNQTSLTCECPQNGGLTSVTSTVALDDAVWVDDEGLLHCFDTVGFATSDAIDLTGHEQRWASSAAAIKPQVGVADTSSHVDHVDTARVHAALGSGLLPRDNTIPLDQAICHTLVLNDDYKLYGVCGPAGAESGQCSELWLDECFLNADGSLQPQKNGGYPGSCNRCSLTNNTMTMHCACKRGSDQSWWWTDVYLGNILFLDGSNILSCFDNHGVNDWCAPGGKRSVASE